jgi:hypothetical protein
MGAGWNSTTIASSRTRAKSIHAQFPHIDLGVVEQVVREELDGWRRRAPLQTFVPVFVHRSARDRLNQYAA